MVWKAEIRKEELKLPAAGETCKTVFWRSFYTSGFSAQGSLIVAKTSKEVAFTFFGFCLFVCFVFGLACEADSFFLLLFLLQHWA